MRNYGIPYRGSKRKIAERLISVLPSGQRFVDLFGGGAAMTCAAVVSGKYESVLYNDLNPLLPPFIKKVLNGDYNADKFTPEWVSRADFFRLKETDGYIKYIWSFGSDGNSYLFGKDIEPLKKAVHEFIVFGKESEGLYKIMPKQYCRMITGDNIKKRRLQWRMICGFLLKQDTLGRNIQLERLERLQQFENLRSFYQKNTLNFSNISYEDYSYKEGDIVYCDPPYEQFELGKKSCDDYDGLFNSTKFYDWVYNADFPVWFSSYKISDDRFETVWSQRTITTMCATNNSKVVYECLYANQKAFEMCEVFDKYVLF